MKNFRRNTVAAAVVRNQHGFSLVELMIVIAIIALLIGVGIPAWTYMVQSGNETSAIQNLNTMRTLQTQYASRNQQNFGTFKDLADKVGLDAKFKEGDEPVINGYKFKMVVVPKSSNAPASYRIYAQPQVAEGIQATGGRSFFTSSASSGIKFKEGATDQIDESSPSI